MDHRLEFLVLFSAVLFDFGPNIPTICTDRIVYLVTRCYRGSHSRSSLIHIAIMVTTSIFMIARCSPLFEYPPMALIIITFAGSMTSFLAATTGILQNDLKRVIAYSTCIQLGYMIFSCGISNYLVSIFHLMNHAFFKALLFLSAGSVINAMSDEQDMRKMLGLISSSLLPMP